jgi:hypothetical protein
MKKSSPPSGQLTVETESRHQLAERITATVVGNLGAGNGKEPLAVLGSLGRLDALDRAETRLRGRMTLRKGVDAMYELAVVCISRHCFVSPVVFQMPHIISHPAQSRNINFGITEIFSKLAFCM